eukprot:5233092-Amphidinium_carterae.1
MSGIYLAGVFLSTAWSGCTPPGAASGTSLDRVHQTGTAGRLHCFVVMQTPKVSATPFVIFPDDEIHVAISFGKHSKTLHWAYSVPQGVAECFQS